MREHRSRMPMYTALMALVVYVLTLSRGVTITGMPLAAKVAGWDWQPMVSQPLLWLVTLPLRLLPADWVPFSLNLLSAMCAAATLGLLARSVQLLLRHRAPSKSGAAGLPGLRRNIPLGMVLACVVCGLEFNFWQAATGAQVGELLDLFLLAVAIWLLLEFRPGREADLRWIYAAAFVWGLGMVENWVMLLALPLFVAALVALRWVKFFELGFLKHLARLGLAGLSTYAILPLVNGLLPGSPWSFGHAWYMSLKATKLILWTLFEQFGASHQLVTVIVLLYFSVPIAACLVRQQNRELAWIAPMLRGLCLLACLWLALDPISGPRQIVLSQAGVALPLLTFDYLNALGAGYLAGYFLRISQEVTGRFGKHHLSRRLKFWLGWATAPALTVMVVLMAVGLTLQNGPVIRQAYHYPLASFGELAVRGLPEDGGAVLSDDAMRLIAFQAALSRQSKAGRWLAVDTQSLPDPEYRRWLERARPSGWLTDATRRTLDPLETSALLQEVARTNRILYLHPSYGQFFESFYPQPRGVLYEMKSWSQDRFEREPISAGEVAQAEKVWDEVWLAKAEPISRTLHRHPGLVEKYSHHLALNVPPAQQCRLLGEWYSVALNAWGVELQRDGHLPEAQRRFEQAVALNTNNFVAPLNLYCNTNLQAGNRLDLAGVQSAAGLIGDLRLLGNAIKRTGPFDGPVLCYLLGGTYQEMGLLRQAAQQLERAHTLAPGTLAPEFFLVQLYSQARRHDKVLETVARLRNENQERPLSQMIDVEISMLEARAWFSQTNPVKADAILKAALKKYPGDQHTLEMARQTYLAFGDQTNALQLVTEQLVATPNNVSALIDQAASLLLLAQGSNAIPILDHVLAITNSPKARLNRALAYLLVGNLDAAEADYLQMTNAEANARVVTATFQMNRGLAEIAARRHDTNLAIHHLELCLSNAPPDTAPWREAWTRLNSLKPSAQKN